MKGGTLMNVTVLGSGTWGTALAIVLNTAGHSVTVLSSSAEKAAALSAARVHPDLPDVRIPEAVRFTGDPAEAVPDAEILLVTVASPYLRSVMTRCLSYIKEGQIIACGTKGLEKDTLMTMTEVIGEITEHRYPTVALSGPTHAEEVVLGMPTLIISAGEDLQAASVIQQLFAGTCIRPYTSADVRGVELCGALKNIIALACGIAAGLGLGDNTRAAIMTRGIYEIARVGRALGCSERTFAGLAGIGDLIVTATSMHSRNNRTGILIGQGVVPEEAVHRIGMAVEGINALPAAISLAEQHDVEIPIISAVRDIISGHKEPKEVVQELLNRSLKPEDPALRYEKDLLH